MTEHPNPPAFPHVTQSKRAGSDTIFTHVTEGMSLRDWFAGQALCGLLANSGNNAVVAGLADENGVTVDEWLAMMAFNAADALLAERNRSNQP